MKGRNYQIHEHIAYLNFYIIIKITILIVITDPEAEEIFYAFMLS